jgi:hypothetical protein
MKQEMKSAPPVPLKTGRAAAAAAAAAALPRVRALHEQWQHLDRQYGLHLLLPAALGIFFAFFGGASEATEIESHSPAPPPPSPSQPPPGTFCTLIIAVEAIRLSGWRQLVDPLLQLYADACAVAARVEQQQRDSRERLDAAAAMSVFFKEVDPVRLGGALAALKSEALEPPTL